MLEFSAQQRAVTLPALVHARCRAALAGRTRVLPPKTTLALSIAPVGFTGGRITGASAAVFEVPGVGQRVARKRGRVIRA